MCRIAPIPSMPTRSIPVWRSTTPTACPQLVRCKATLKIYPGAPHGLAATHKDQLDADLLAFFKG